MPEGGTNPLPFDGRFDGLTSQLGDRAYLPWVTGGTGGGDATKGHSLTVKEFLRRASEFLGGLLETLEVLTDKELMKAIHEAEEDERAGKTRDYEEFLDELRKSGEM